MSAAGSFAVWARHGRVLRLPGLSIRLLLVSMSSTPSGSGHKLADAFLRAKAQAWAIQPSALAMTRPEMLKIQTAALGIMQPKLAASVVSSKFSALQPFRLPPRYFDHLWNESQVASFTNLIKTLQLDLPDFSKLVVHQGLFDRLDTSLSEHGSAVPAIESAIEAATDAVQRAHPWLSRSTVRTAVVFYFNLLTAAVIVYGLAINPITMLLLVASGLTAKDGGRVAGQLFDKINPPEDSD
jgi:hypothetical protein